MRKVSVHTKVKVELSLYFIKEILYINGDYNFLNQMDVQTHFHGAQIKPICVTGFSVTDF